LPAENLFAQLGFCNRVRCNHQVSCKRTPLTSTQPQPSSMELGGAYIIFDARFILYIL
jgi:hypothetical protein